MDSDTSTHEYNTRSKGPVVHNTSNTQEKSVRRKKKLAFEVIKTLPKQTVEITSNISSDDSNKSNTHTIIKSTKKNNNLNNTKKEESYNISLDTKEGLSLLLMKSLVDAANNKLKKKNKKKKKKIDSDETQVNVDREGDNNASNSDHSSDEDYTDNEDSDDEFQEKLGLHEDIEYTQEEKDYIKKLSKEEQQILVQKENKIMDVLKDEVPIRFKILNSNMKLRTVANILTKIDHFYTLDPTDNEYQKLYPWVEQLDKIPFDKYAPVLIKNTDTPSKIKQYLSDTRLKMDEAIFGHDVAKTQILSVIAREIANPSSAGNSIAIQGPMGNGKTTLIKEGVCKAMNRPFAFIALGGMQDSSFLLGHEITYEGSKCGRIIEMLVETGCMNPVIFFDELDKVSDTPKGEEITNLLCHLTDSSQNKEFHDKYFSGIDFDLSRATFIFSYNDESKINPILLDRMYKIKTEGFDKKSKTKISLEYLLPKVLKEFNFNKEDIVFTENAIHSLIEYHSNSEKGVRNLKRNIETIIAKLNIMRYLKPDKVQLTIDNKLESVVENKDDTSAAEESNIELSLVENKDDTSAAEESKIELPTSSISVKNDVQMENFSNNSTITMESKALSIDDIINFKITNFQIPYTVTDQDIKYFMEAKSKNASFEYLYM